MPLFQHGASRVYYEESGSGEPLLLLPGFSDSIAGHAVLRETLAKRYRVKRPTSLVPGAPGRNRGHTAPATTRKMPVRLLRFSMSEAQYGPTSLASATAGRSRC
jgi:hypothetical protein